MKNNNILYEQELKECIEMHEKMAEQTNEPYFHDMQKTTVVFLKDYQELKEKEKTTRNNRRSQNHFFIAAMIIILLVQIGLLLFDILNTEVPFSIIIAVLCIPNTLISLAMNSQRNR